VEFKEVSLEVMVESKAKELEKFYKNKNVIITGHSGFKGAWLSLLLKSFGAKVHGYSLKPETQDSLFNLVEIHTEIEESIFGDIRNNDQLDFFIKKSNADIVIHMAAQPLVRKSYRDPIETYSTNVIGTVNLFEAIRRNPQNIKAIVNVTTDKCYENKEWIYPYRENDVLGGYDPYSASKACAELITSSYRQSFFKEMNISLASARAGNVIGGGDFAEDRIIPDIIRAIAQEKSIVLRNPNAIRPWQHTLDALFGYILLGMKLYQEGDKYATSYNFAPNNDGKNITVGEISKDFIKLLDRNECKIVVENSNIHEAHFLRLDNSKAKQELDWTPTFDVKQSLNITADWYNCYLNNNSDIKDFTNKQIQHFINSV